MHRGSIPKDQIAANTESFEQILLEATITVSLKQHTGQRVIPNLGPLTVVFVVLQIIPAEVYSEILTTAWYS